MLHLAFKCLIICVSASKLHIHGLAEICKWDSSRMHTVMSLLSRLTMFNHPLPYPACSIQMAPCYS